MGLLSLDSGIWGEASGTPSRAPGQVRIVHVSDIHFWQYVFNPLRLMSKRLVGMTSLLLGRARRFRLERVPELVNQVLRLDPDHILITGDLTTTALPDEFQAARAALSGWFDDPARVTIVPGNHDRYTLRAHRSRLFEHYFAAFAPRREFPWLRRIDSETAILGLDPTRAGISARGKLSAAQLLEAQEILAKSLGEVHRLVIACHYPVSVPREFHHESARKPLVNAPELRQWLRTIGPHLYCCGHVHAAWAFRPQEVSNQLCINPGAPLLSRPSTGQLPGFAEIALRGGDVTVSHYAWTGETWKQRQLYHADAFFRDSSPNTTGRSAGDKPFCS
jgi:predicted phosphodiesterase